MTNFLRFVIIAVGSYLLGNITFARLLSRTRNNDDITTHGSGNPGTMNVLRTHGVGLAILTLVFDALKSVIACVLSKYWISATGGSEYLMNLAVYLSGVCCVIGHMYPVLYKFKGGKGIATGLGLTIVAHPVLSPIIFGVYLIVFLIWKIGSLGSLIATTVYTIIDSVLLLRSGYYYSFLLLLLMISLIFYAHRQNIIRLFENKENKIDLEAAVQKDKDYAEEQKKKRQETLEKHKKRKQNNK